MAEKRSNSKMMPAAAAAVIIAALAGRCGLGAGVGFFPGGAGSPGAQSGAAAEQKVMASTAAAAAETSAAPETAVKEPEIRIVEVTVNEDGYLYQNSKQSLEDIFADIGEGDEIHLTILRASKNDVDDLEAMAKEKGVKVVRED